MPEEGQSLEGVSRELSDLRSRSEQLAAVETLRSQGLLLEVDYPCRPRSRDWSNSPAVQKLNARFARGREAYAEALRRIGAHASPLGRIEVAAPVEPGSPEPYWGNGWLPGLDAASLYAFVADRRPAIYMEVGSGNSTKFVRRAIRDHNLQTRIVSIDPQPRAEVDRICDEVIRMPLEEADLSVFDGLTPEDVLFVDNSHRALPNSDVTVFFMEVLGRLPPGLLYGIHDIFLPKDYPENWSARLYSEEYLLACYLFGGADGDEIVLPCAFVSHDAALTSELDVLWRAEHLSGIEPYGGAFWMKKA